MKKYVEIFLTSLYLGFTSFGGPIAHLGYFQHTYVTKRKWLDEDTLASLIAFCQFLPGPASSQVGIGIGAIRAGYLGGFIAWLGFTMPSVIVLYLFSILVSFFSIDLSWIQGLKIVAVVVVIHALLGMGKKLTPDATRITIAFVSATVALLVTNPFIQVFIILLAAMIGLYLYRREDLKVASSISLTFLSKKVALLFIALFFLFLFGLPLIRSMFGGFTISYFDTFYRVGSLVFGGGHVVLPMLEKEVVTTNWISEELFLAGYGAAQAVPGPLFTFAGYLGGIFGGWKGSLIATIAIFLPSFFLIYGFLPFFQTIQNNVYAQRALKGINAAVVGILLAALYDPIWTSTIHTTIDFIFAMILFLLLVFWRWPSWAIVFLGIMIGFTYYSI